MHRPSGDPRDFVPKLRDRLRDLDPFRKLDGGETEDTESGVKHGVVVSAYRSPILFRGRRAVAAAAEAFMQHMRAPPPAPGGGGPPRDQVAKMLRMHLEKVEKKVDSVVSVSQQLVVSIKSAVNSCVRNEIHMKRIEDRALSVESKVEDAIRSGREAIDLYKQSYLLTEERYSSLKSTLDSVIQELKSSKAKSGVLEKTWVQEFDEAFETLDKVYKFPDRVLEVMDRLARYAATLELVLRCIGSLKHQEIEQVVHDLKDLKRTCDGISLIEGTYAEIGKKASDLLYQYYVPGVTAVLSADASDGAVFSIPTKNALLADVTFESKATIESNVMEITLNLQDMYYPFVKGSLTAPLPWRSAEAHLHLCHDFGAVDARVEIISSPILNLSCLFGVKAFSIGGDFAVNTSGVFSKYDAGASFAYDDYCVSVKLQDKCQKVSASLFGKLNLVSYALEYIHDMRPSEKNKHKVVAGISGKLNPATEVKAFMDSDYFVGAAIQHRWRPNSSAALSVKFNMKEKKDDYPQFGLSMQFGLKSR